MKNLFILALVILSINLQFAQSDIADARTFAQGQSLTITGIVTNGDELGPIRYVQDLTGGLPFYAPNISDKFKTGDEVTVQGQMGVFNDLLQIINVVDYSIISTGNDLPEPKMVSPNQLNENFEAQLVSIPDAIFNSGGSGNQFSGNSLYTFSAADETSQIYIRNGNDLVGTSIPATSVNLTGIVSVYQGQYQLLPRSEDDITGNIISNISQSNISTTGFTISWKSNFSGNTAIKYGTDLNNMTSISSSQQEGFDHSINLNTLEASTFYYVQVESSNSDNTSISTPRLFSTASLSSGDMIIYFNHAVDHSVASGQKAVDKPGLQIEKDIIDFINNAQTSIDMAFYNINRVPIVDALNDALDRGITVRYIANDGTYNGALLDGSPKFNHVYLNKDNLMHNKFMIVDASSTTDAWLMSGSMNLTVQNMTDDFNNVLFIQDEALAKSYTLEFNEMWGGSGATPNSINFRSGNQKTNNTPHQFSIGGEKVESYFSPSDHTTNAIAKALQTADESIDFATLVFTRNDLRDELINAHDNGIDVRGFIENTNDTGSDFLELQSSGINVLDHPESGSIHHKYAIIDARRPDSDPQVITGSHNWTTSAEARNDENTLILHSPLIANLFLQEFEGRWKGLLSEVQNQNLFEGLGLTITPNPTSEIAHIRFNNPIKNKIAISIWNASGIKLKTYIVKSRDQFDVINIDVSMYPAGIYFITGQTNNQIIMSQQMIIQH